MKLHSSVADATWDHWPYTGSAKKRKQSARENDSHSTPASEDFATRITRAINERATSALTQQQHRELVEQRRARYRPLRPRPHRKSD